MKVDIDCRYSFCFLPRPVFKLHLSKQLVGLSHAFVWINLYIFIDTRAAGKIREGFECLWKPNKDLNIYEISF